MYIHKARLTAFVKNLIGVLLLVVFMAWWIYGLFSQREFFTGNRYRESSIFLQLFLKYLPILLICLLAIGLGLFQFVTGMRNVFRAIFIPDPVQTPEQAAVAQDLDQKIIVFSWKGGYTTDIRNIANEIDCLADGLSDEDLSQVRHTLYIKRMTVREYGVLADGPWKSCNPQ